MRAFSVVVRPIVQWIVALGLSFAIHGASAQTRQLDQTDGPSSEQVDLLGDPLPPGARLRLGTQRFRHPSSAIELALSPDEKTVVTIGRRMLVAWDTETGLERWRTDGREPGLDVASTSYGVRAAAFNGDSVLLTPGGPNLVRIWNVNTGESETRYVKIEPGPAANRSPLIHRPGSIKSVDVASEGDLLAAGNEHGLVVVDAEGKVLLEIPNRPGSPLGINDANRDRLTFGGDYSLGVFSPDGTKIGVVISDSPTEIHLFDIAKKQKLRRIKLREKTVRFDFSPDGTQIVATHRDSAARLYSVATGEEIWSFDIEVPPRGESYTCGVKFSPDGGLIAVCAPIASDYGIYLLDATSGQPVRKLVGHTWKPWSVTFTADGQTLYSTGWDGSVRRWNVATGEQLALPLGIRATGVTATDGKSRIAYADDRGIVRVVGTQTGEESESFQLDGKFSQLDFSPDGSQLAAGASEGELVTVVIWDLTTGKIYRKWEWPRGRDLHSSVESLKFSPDGQAIAAAVFRQSKAYMWDVQSSELISELPHAQVYGLAFSPDGSMLATAGWDKTIRFWDAKTGASRRQHDVAAGGNLKGDLRMYNVVYSPLGDVVASAHLDGMVRMWRPTDMKLMNESKVANFTYGAIAFSPGGEWWASVSSQGQVSLWDALSGEKVHDLGRHQHYGYTVGFAEAGRSLLSGGRDGICYLWELTAEEDGEERSIETLWDELTAAGPDSYRAAYQLRSAPAGTVAFLRKRLSSVETVLDLTRVAEGLSQPEADRRLELARQLVSTDESVESALVVQRAVSLLSQIGSPEAIRVLKELVERDRDGELGSYAAAAIARSTGH